MKKYLRPKMPFGPVPLRPIPAIRPAAVACLLLTGVLAAPGCGGGGRSAVIAPGGTAAPSPNGIGRATFTVNWPVPAPTRLIPSAANSIVITLSRALGGPAYATQTLSRPAGGGASTASFDNLPPGILYVSAVARPGADGSGVTQASAASSVSIVVGKTAALSLALASEIDRLEVTPSTLALTVRESAPLTITAKNKAGEIVLIDPAKLTYSSFITGLDFRLDTSDVATADGAGKVTAGIATGIAGIVVTETESGKTAKVDVTVSPPADKPVTQQSVTFQIDASHSGRATFDQTLYFPNRKAWSLPIAVSSSPVVADGRVFAAGTMGGAAGLYAFDRATGKRLWGPVTAQQTGGLQPKTLTYDNGTLIVGGTNDSQASATTTAPLLGIDPATGAIRWRFQALLFWTVPAAPVAVNGTVYFSYNGTARQSSGHQFRQVALDSATGTQRWVHSEGSFFGRVFVNNEPPTISPENGAGYFVRNGVIEAISLAEGSLLWESSLPQQLRYAYPPVLHKGTLLTQGLNLEDAYLSDPPVLDSRTGSQSGTYRWYATTPALSDTIRLQIRTEGLLAVDPATQQTVWSLPNRSWYSPIFINDTAFVMSQDGYVLALEGITGKILWRSGFVSDYTFGNNYDLRIFRGMAAGEGYLVVPTDNALTAWHLAGPK